MGIEYDKLTADQLEEWAELIDWSMVPSHLLTPRMAKNFSPVFNDLKARIWLEELLNSLELKIYELKYPHLLSFSKEGNLYMELDITTGELWCSSTRMWSVFEEKFYYEYDEIQKFIKNVVESRFKNMKIKLKCLLAIDGHEVKSQYEIKKIKPQRMNDYLPF